MQISESVTGTNMQVRRCLASPQPSLYRCRTRASKKGMAIRVDRHPFLFPNKSTLCNVVTLASPRLYLNIQQRRRHIQQRRLLNLADRPAQRTCHHQPTSGPDRAGRASTDRDHNRILLPIRPRSGQALMVSASRHPKNGTLTYLHGSSRSGGV